MRSQADIGVSQLANDLCLHCSEQRRLRPSSQIQQNRKPIGQEEEQEERRGEIFIHPLSLRDEAK